MTQAQYGLDGRLQVQILADWEWRADNIYMVGCTMQRDVRLRYLQHMPEFFDCSMDYSTTQVPIFDSEEAIAYGVVKALMPTFGASNESVLQISAHYDDAIHDLKNEYVKRRQRINYKRRA